MSTVKTDFWREHFQFLDHVSYAKLNVNLKFLIIIYNEQIIFLRREKNSCICEKREDIGEIFDFISECHPDIFCFFS